MNNRWIEIHGIENMRDLGGLKNDSGEILAENQFIRSAGLNHLDERGKKALKEHGIDTIVDLRSTHERERYPTPIEPEEGFNLYSVPLLDQFKSAMAEGKKVEMPKSMLDIYKYLLEGSGEEYKEILHYLANTKGGSVFHCSVGKDRTGLTAMFLLSIAGVSQQDIIEDYALSKPLVGALENLGEDVPKEILYAKPEWMEELFVWIQEKYGSITKYLQSIGVPKEDFQKIRDKFQVS